MSDTQTAKAVDAAIQSFDKIRKLRNALEMEEKNFPQLLLTAAATGELKFEDSTHQKLMKILVLTLADRDSDFVKSLKQEHLSQEKYQTKMRQLLVSILEFYGEMKQGDRAADRYSFWLSVSPREIFDVHVDWSNAQIKAEPLTRG